MEGEYAIAAGTPGLPLPSRERAGVRGAFPAHFINLASLRHPISADLFIEKTAPGTKAILLRLLGGLDYWRYGAEQLAHACRKHGVTLAVLPGDGRADPGYRRSRRLAPAELEVLDRLASAGGPRERRACDCGAHGACRWNGNRVFNPAGGSAARIRHLPADAGRRRQGGNRLLRLFPGGRRCPAHRRFVR